MQKSPLGSSRATPASRSLERGAGSGWSRKSFYAGAVDKHHGQTIPAAGGVAATFREPLGVVGLIVPWYYPLNIASWKLGAGRSPAGTPSC
jgi:acyl-CoA reductase-like NAD-dependent aldehyde dehydrogenase